jgi:hypothetical protein
MRFFTTHGKKKQLTTPGLNGALPPLPCASIKMHGNH